MLNQYLNQGTDRRLDPDKQREVIELATRLQEINRDHLSETELEEQAVEAGLEREYVREAIRKISATPIPIKPRAVPVRPKQAEVNVWPETTLSLVIMLWALFCNSQRWETFSHGTLFMAAVPFAFVIGLFARTRGLALTFGILVGVSTMMCMLGNSTMAAHLASFALYGVVCLGGNGVRRAWLKMRAPEPVPEPPPIPAAIPMDDRLERLERLWLMRAELESEKTSRAFLSVDVVGSVQTKAQLGDLESERLFGLYQRWISSTVGNFGGEVGTSAGDGAMAMFPNGTSAVRCAKALQSGVGAFNSQSGGDMRLRCGISVGAVPWRPGTTIGSIHSPVVDRAAVRQKMAPAGTIAVGEELLGEAAYEFGGIQVLPDTTGDRVFYGTVA